MSFLCFFVSSSSASMDWSEMFLIPLFTLCESFNQCEMVKENIHQPFSFVLFSFKNQPCRKVPNSAVAVCLSVCQTRFVFCILFILSAPRLADGLRMFVECLWIVCMLCCALASFLSLGPVCGTLSYINISSCMTMTWPLCVYCFSPEHAYKLVYTLPICYEEVKVFGLFSGPVPPHSPCPPTRVCAFVIVTEFLSAFIFSL